MKEDERVCGLGVGQGMHKWQDAKGCAHACKEFGEMNQLPLKNVCKSPLILCFFWCYMGADTVFFIEHGALK